MKELITLFLLLLTVKGWAQVGTLDNSFGGDGIVVTTLDKALNSRTMQLQPDGKVVVCGWYGITSRKLLLARYNTDGSLDTSFGVDGVFTGDFNIYDAVNFTLLPNGKFVAVGDLNTFPDDAWVARLNANGTLDTSFGDGGVIFFDFPDATKLEAVAAGPGDKLSIGAIQNDANIDWKIMAIRLNADGSFDNSFGTNGITSLGFTSTSDVQDVKLRPDGGMVLCGSSGAFGAFNMTAFTASGALDASFGTNGEVLLDDLPGATWAFNLFRSLEIDANGNIYGVGAVEDNLTVVKMNANGVLDANYGDNGLSTHTFAEASEGYGMAFDTDGKLVVGGQTGPFLGSTGSKLIIVRLNTDGSLDTDFGTNGQTLVSIEPDYTQAVTDVVVRPNGKIVAFGESLKPFPIGNLVLIGLESGLELAAHEQSGPISSASVSPNPVSDAFALRYQLAVPASVSLHLVDASGHSVQSLQPVERLAAGAHETQFQLDGTVASGHYRLVMKVAEGGTVALPVVVIR